MTRSTRTDLVAHGPLTLNTGEMYPSYQAHSLQHELSPIQKYCESREGCASARLRGVNMWQSFLAVDRAVRPIPRLVGEDYGLNGFGGQYRWARK